MLNFQNFFNIIKEKSYYGEVVPGNRLTLQAESTLASVYMREKLTPLPESIAGLAFQ